MIERSSLKLLRLFSLGELKKFRLFLESPYFNKNKDLLIIYDAIFLYLKDKVDCDFDNYVMKYCSKNKLQINQSSYEKHLSNIYILAYDFIAKENQSSDNIKNDIAVLDYFKNKGDDLHFNKLLKKTYKKLNSKKDSIDKYKLFANLKDLESDFIVFNRNKRNNEIYLDEKSKALDIYYISQKLKDANLKLNRQMVMNVKFDLSITNNLLTTLPKEVIKNNALTNCYYTALKVIAEESKNKKKHFKDLELLLENNLTIIDDSEINVLYSFMQNYASKVFIEKNEYYKYMFTLYKTLLANKLIYFNGKILAPTFKNIVNIAIKLKELNWLETFLSEHKNKIQPINVNSDVYTLYNYSLARLLFFKQNFEETQKLIVSLNFKDIYYKISLKRLELMLYFEKEEWLLLDSLIKAFRVSLIPKRTETIPELHLNYNLNFIKYFGKLYAINNSTKEGSKKLLALKNQLSTIIEISEKDWLQSKLQ